jgi:hypothetical protein
MFLRSDHPHAIFSNKALRSANERARFIESIERGLKRLSEVVGRMIAARYDDDTVLEISDHSPCACSARDKHPREERKAPRSTCSRGGHKMVTIGKCRSIDCRRNR